MPFVDPTHHHWVSQVIEDNTQTPLDPGGGGGATPTLAEVLAAGNDMGAGTIIGPYGFISMGEAASLYGIDGTGSAPGGYASLMAGNDANGGAGAAIQASPGDGIGGPGRLTITTDGSYGTLGQVLTAQGDTTAIWATLQAAYVDPATGDIADVISALIAAGLMAGPA
jgi:hypothetical protein